MQHATNDCFKVDEVNTVCFFSGWESGVELFHDWRNEIFKEFAADVAMQAK